MRGEKRRRGEDRNDARVERDSADPSETVDTFERAELPPLLTTACSGSESRVQGLGFRVQGSGFRVQGTGYRVRGSGFRVQG